MCDLPHQPRWHDCRLAVPSQIPGPRLPRGPARLYSAHAAACFSWHLLPFPSRAAAKVKSEPWSRPHLTQRLVVWWIHARVLPDDPRDTCVGLEPIEFLGWPAGAHYLRQMTKGEVWEWSEIYWGYKYEVFVLIIN